MLRVPLIEDLTRGSIPPGSNIVVEYDSASQWYATSVTITVGWMRAGGRVYYNLVAFPPDDLRAKLSKLGVQAHENEKIGMLRVYDWYHSTLGVKSTEKFAPSSLKVSELSIEYARFVKEDPGGADVLRIMTSYTPLSRFNDEKALLDFILARPFPRSRAWKSTGLHTFVRGVHSDAFYRQLEDAADGTVEFKLDESGDEPVTLMRIRNMRNVGFDGKWHRLRISDSFEASLF